jgi:catechol 1,2-dioxygenase
MDRKKFIISSALTAFSMSTFGSVIKNSSGELTGDCETTNDILGPFYREDAPIRSDLTYKGLDGSKIILRGKVYRSDCITPIKNAMVEIWHCDTAGEYDNDSNEYRQRGRWKTNEDGEYSFRTILPGKYLNGRLYRPSHIHYRVTAPGSKELISQIYFNGDPHIKEDPWASQSKAKGRILPISLIDIKGNLTINFDISLKEA